MAFEITSVEIWSGSIEDKPGALAGKLASLQEAGANLEFCIVRPAPDTDAGGVLFVAPLVGEAQLAAARGAGLKKSERIHALRLVGPDRPGLLAGVAKTLADERLNIGGVSAAAIDERALIYLRFNSTDDARRAAQILTRALA